MKSSGPRAYTLGVLVTGASAFLAVLLAFLLARVAGQKTGPFQRGAQIGVVLLKGLGDAVPDGSGLAGDAAAVGQDVEIELAACPSA